MTIAATSLCAPSADAVTVRLFSTGISPGSQPTRIVAARDGNLWFTQKNADKIGRITPSGTVTESAPLNNSPAGPFGITTSPDGLLWFTKNTANKVTQYNPSTGLEAQPPGSQPSAGGLMDIVVGPDGLLWLTENANPGHVAKFNPATLITEFPTPTADSGPSGIAVGSDGNLWFTEASVNKIGSITTAPAPAISEQPSPLPTAGSGPSGIAPGPDGNLWFTEKDVGQIGRITTGGAVTEYPIPGGGGSQPTSIVAGPDGNLWFTEFNGSQIGRITTSGTITQFISGSQPSGITVGPDGNVWFTLSGGNAIGRATTDVEPPRYTNADPITVPAAPSTAGPADIYPATVEASGLQGTVSEVSVRLNGLYHDGAGDLDALLVGPQGQKALLLADSTGNRDVATGPVITLDDDGVTSPARLVSGIFKPILGSGTATFAAPAPSSPYGTSLSVFDGTNPNGVWKLFVQDDSANAFDGAISGGWSLDIQTTPDPVQVPGPTVEVPVPGPIVTVAGPTTTVVGPPVVETPLVDTTNPALKLGTLAARMPQARFRKGVRLGVTPSEPVTLDVTMSLKPKRAIAAAADELLLYERTITANRATTITAKPSVRYLGRPKKSFRVVLRIVASDKAGNRVTVKKAITVVPDKKRRR